MIGSYCQRCGSSVGCNRRCKRCYPDPVKAPAPAPKAATPFEKWVKKIQSAPSRPEVSLWSARQAWLACAAEAERLCFENTKVCGHPGALCHLMDGNDIRAKLAEVERG